MMTFVLAKITGVPVLEKRLIHTRPGCAEDVRRTSPLFPLPPSSREPVE